MKILFMARPNYDKISAALYKEIKSRLGDDFSAGFVVCNADEENFIAEATGSGSVFRSDKFMKKNKPKLGLELLCHYESKFDCAPVWKYIYTDRYLIHRGYDEAVKIASGLFMFFDDIFSSGSYDVYYDEAISTLMSYVAYIVGKHYGTRYICQMVARGNMSGTHHYFTEDPYQYDAEFDKDYKSRIYSREEIERASEYLADFEKHDSVYGNMVITGKKPTLQLVFLKLAITGFFKRKYRNKYDYLNYRMYRVFLHRFGFYFNYLKCRKYYEKADLGRKYVFFPLHYQPEASTIVCAQKYEKQLFLIDSIAKSLPADTVLYVKEHYALLGHRERDFYEKLKSYPNVFMIDPYEKSRRLIEKSEAVITLTGTAGWEAVLMRKPVIMAGNIFFDNAPGVIKTDELFGSYMKCISDYNQPTKDELVQYLCEYLRSVHEGNAYFAHPDALNPENIAKVTDSLLNRIFEIEV